MPIRNRLRKGLFSTVTEISAYHLTYIWRPREEVMAHRCSPVTLICLLLVPFAPAKDKKEILPAYVLNARTVAVVIDPDAGRSLSNPNENRTAQEDVEKALMNWGRFSVVLDPLTADLVISVRRAHGKAVTPTIGGIPNERPVIVEPIDSGIRVGGEHGPAPVTANAPPPGPLPQGEIGPSEDTFAVYRGRADYPLDSPTVWRYTAKEALSSPSVPAVAQFREAIDQSLKTLAQKQQKKP